MSYVHLCNVENDKSRPSSDLLAKYKEVFGVDLYVYAWCTAGDVDRLPLSLRGATERLASEWRRVIEQRKRQFGPPAE